MHFWSSSLNKSCSNEKKVSQRGGRKIKNRARGQNISSIGASTPEIWLFLLVFENWFLRIQMGFLGIPMGFLRIPMGFLRIPMGFLRIQLGFLRIQMGFLKTVKNSHISVVDAPIELIFWPRARFLILWPPCLLTFFHLSNFYSVNLTNSAFFSKKPVKQSYLCCSCSDWADILTTCTILGFGTAGAIFSSIW